MQRHIKPVADGTAKQAPVQVLHKTIEAGIQVCRPLDGFLVDGRPVDGRHTLVEFFGDEFADFVPVPRLDRVEDGFQERAVALESVVRHDAARDASASAASPAAGVFRGVQAFELVKTRKAALRLLDLFGRSGSRAAHPRNTGRSRSRGGHALAGQKRYQARDIAEHGGRRIGERGQRRGQHLDDGGSRCLRCAGQVAQRGAQGGRRSQRRTHVVRQIAQPRRDQVEHQRAGHNARQTVREQAHALAGCVQTCPHAADTAFKHAERTPAKGGKRGKRPLHHTARRLQQPHAARLRVDGGLLLLQTRLQPFVPGGQALHGGILRRIRFGSSGNSSVLLFKLCGQARLLR